VDLRLLAITTHPRFNLVTVYAPWFCSFRLWRFINHLLTYLLNFEQTQISASRRQLQWVLGADAASTCKCFSVLNACWCVEDRWWFTCKIKHLKTVPDVVTRRTKHFTTFLHPRHSRGKSTALKHFCKCFANVLFSSNHRHLQHVLNMLKHLQKMFCNIFANVLT